MSLDGRAPSASDPASSEGPPVLRFGVFELDRRTGELRRGGALVKLQHQPFKVLALLVAHAGDLVTREELRRQVWGGDTYVDFDQGLNFCIKQIRTALGDQADTPRYIETLPRRGYRFIAPVEPVVAVAPPPPVRAVVVEPAPRQPTPLPFPAPERRRRSDERRRPRRWAWAAAAAGALTLGATGFAVGRASTTPAAPSFLRLTFSRGMVLGARFAADGQVLYSAAWNGAPADLFATRHGAPDTRALGVSGVRLAAAAGAEAAVRRLDGGRFTLARMPITGGPMRDIAEDVGPTDWSRDGSVFATVRSTGGGPPRLEFPLGTPLPEALQGWVSMLRLAPSTDSVALLEHPVPGDDRGSVVLVDRAGRRRVLSSGWASLEGLAWSSDGAEVWFTGTRMGADSALHAVTLDGRERLLYRGPGRLVLHDVSAGGRTLLSRNSLRMELRVRRGDEPERDLTWFDLPYLAGLGADGRSVVFGESGEAGGPNYSIFLRRDGSPPVRLGEGRPLGFSPDGEWVASIPVAPPFHLVLIPTGAGPTRTVPLDTLQDLEELGFMPDGAGVVLSGRQRGRPPRLFLQPLRGGDPRPVTPEGVSARHVAVSPDGAWVPATGSDRTLALYPLAGGDPRPVKGAEPGDHPLQWSADGAALFVERGRLPMQVYRIELASGRRQLWRELAPEDRAGVAAIGRITLTPDGRSHAYGYARALSELYVVDGLR